MQSVKTTILPLALLSASFTPLTALAEEPTIPQNVSDSPSIIGRLLQKNNSDFLALYPYESNYLLYTYTSNINRESIQSYSWSDHARKDEAKFQISLGFPIYRGIFGENSVLAASYTQQSWWQAFNSAQSSPFRETNYEPQLFVGFKTEYEFLGWTLKDIEVGFNHQSNGRSQATSRSWNRVYARAMAMKDNFMIDLKAWYRIPESSSSDDNPDLTKYVGYYRLTLGYSWNSHMFTAQGRYNWNTGYGNAELGWSYPVSDVLRIYTQLYTGYGESLIDYNYKQTRFGVGIKLGNLF
nr:phospholipase A [Zophobihabitans entericus]